MVIANMTNLSKFRTIH